MTDQPDVTTDRAVLSEDAYADDRHLSARQSLYQYQEPSYDLPQIVSDLIGSRGGLVADIGCGNGWYVSKLRREHPDWTVIGIDLSAGMLATLDPPVVQADAMRLPFADGSLDVVLGMHMIYHLPDVRAGITELARVLRAGGMLVASTNADDDKAELDDLWTAATARVTDSPPQHRLALSTRFRLDDAPTILLRVFDDVTIRDLPGTITVTTPDPVMAHLSSYESFAAITEAPFPATVDAARDILAAHIADKGAFKISCRSGIITARRKE
jgi:SAM-dependent methyltransferase